ncbi:MAG: penicillin-insensitive murein endopeptidase [Deltaproteobacteria bacterium]|jgi:penicillin-insensitive murein endopeptidase|nr:penicillin-insensitive murein endopeptidase [Deltaproteobacteria bacterium]
MSKYPILIFFFILSVQLESSASLPENCKRLPNGRISCRLKGRKKAAAKKRINSEFTIPWDKVNKFKRSLSLGHVYQGKLYKGKKLPVNSRTYFISPRTRRRNYVWGTPALLKLVKDVSHKVYNSFPGSKLTIGDLSPSGGGKAAGHKSHQSGRDVDFGFYLSTGKTYKPVKSRFIKIDKSGRGQGIYKHLHFDVERNWELVEALITHKTGVMRIYTSKIIKNLLLQYARIIYRPKSVIKRAQKVLKPYKGHNDHFHIRISCPHNNPFCR